MKKLTLNNPLQSSTTLLENEFIDKYMPEANGEYVKVYLLLLRHLNDPSVSLTVSRIADILDDTEKDVIRALNYWKKLGLLDYESKDERAASKASLAPSDEETEKAKSTPGMKNITRFKSRKELKELLFVAEQYLGKTLTVTDINTITYFYDELGMSADLIEYLIEYCVENGHKSIHYIEKVALSWSEQKITTIQEAKNKTILYNKNCYAVLNAYGIKGRAPAAAETAYIRRWNEEYGLALEIILEACNRTMNTIHQPNFEYTESILKNWMDKKVKHLKDIEAVDLAYQKEKEAKKKAASTAPARQNQKNKFNNFEGRTYEDMDDLARKLIQTQ